MRIAIYSRKSKWTGKGESIENQLIMCREYVKANYPEVMDEDIIEYEDEGFSGKNTHRPQFLKMMGDMRKEHFDFLVCYKLDRLGRNLMDLVSLIEELNQRNTSFISIKEKFDTSTPIGRAMMFFTGVLAQMEREQIAERVRDNMILLARTGRWLGGQTPLGFDSKKEEIQSHNKTKTFYRLTENPKEIKNVRFIYSEFLEKQSLSQLERYFMENGIKTRNGKDYQISGIRDILTNPVYCTADLEAFEYFYRLGCQVCVEEKELDGVHGFISYGKTSSGKYKNRPNDPAQWIISVSGHKGVIPSDQWIKVQEILEVNKKKGDNYRKVQNPVTLLSGLLHCQCGYPMRPKNYSADRIDDDGNRTFSYICSLKEKSKRTHCQSPNIHGNTLDKLVWDKVIDYIQTNGLYSKEFIFKELDRTLEQMNKNGEADISEIDLLQNNLDEKRKQMNQLVTSLSKSEGNTAFLKYVEEQIVVLAQECSQIEFHLEEAQRNIPKGASVENDMEEWKKLFSSFGKISNSFTVLEKRELLRKTLSRVVWNGENIQIYFRS